MNTLEILYEAADQDKIFSFLRKVFADDASEVNVTEIIPDEYVQLTWTDGIQPATVALDLCNAVTTAVIEIDSTTGIDTKSRFFNKTQLY